MEGNESPSPRPHKCQRVQQTDSAPSQLSQPQCLSTLPDAFLDGFPRSFPTWLAFESAFAQFMEDTYQPFRRRSSTSVNVRNRDITKNASKAVEKAATKALVDGTETDQASILELNKPNLLPEEYQTYSRTYLCTHGFDRKTTSSGERTHKLARSTQCRVRVSVTLTSLVPGRYHISVKGSGGAHNHHIGEDVYRHYPANRRIEDPIILETANKMRKSGSKARGIQIFLREASGKLTTRKDTQNMLARMARHDTRGLPDNVRTEEILKDLCTTDEGSAANVFVGKDELAETLVFQTRKMRRLFDAFPEVVMVDTTFGTNKCRYKLFSFVVHDIHGKGQHVQHALMSAEGKANMIDAVDCFKKNNPAWRKIKVIVTDKEFTERRVLREAFPSARLLLCQFHVVKYFTKQIHVLFSGTKEEKDKLGAIMHALVYASSKLEYDRIRALMLSFLGNDEKHPLYSYFIRNWDEITDEWVSFERGNIPHLGNNTNNRIESKWSKLKLDVDDTFELRDCVAVLLGMQALCEEEYEAELKRVGTWQLPRDPDLPELDRKYIGELERLANMISRFALEQTLSEFKYGVRSTTRYRVVARANMVALYSLDEDRKHDLELDAYTCTCIFSRTHLLPCRHAYFYRDRTAGYESVIPFRYIHRRWIRSHEINDIAQADVASSTSLEVKPSSKQHQPTPMSPRGKYTGAKEVLDDIAEIMQNAGMKKYRQMLAILKSFRDDAAVSMVPQVPKLSNMDSPPTSPTRIADTSESVTTTSFSTDSGSSLSCDVTNPDISTSAQTGEVADTNCDQTTQGVIQQSNTQPTSGFILRTASKPVGNSRRRQKRKSTGARVAGVKKAANELAYGISTDTPALSEVLMLLNQRYSYGLCAPLFDRIRTKTATSTDVLVYTSTDVSDKVDHRFMLDKSSVETCLQSLRNFKLKHGLEWSDAEDDNIVVSVPRCGVFLYSQIDVMTKYYEVRSRIKLAKAAMDWVLKLPNHSIGSGIPQHFGEFTDTPKEQHVLALRYCVLADTFLDGDYIDGMKVLSFSGYDWLNTTCVLIGTMFLKRQYPHVGFINPFFSTLQDPHTRSTVAAKLGAFDDGTTYPVYAGILHPHYNHWTAFVLYRNVPSTGVWGIDRDDAEGLVCVIYDCKKSYYKESAALVCELFEDHIEEPIQFVTDGIETYDDGVNCGVVSLLFIEFSLYGNASWTSSTPKHCDYWRLRYLRHALTMLAETK